MMESKPNSVEYIALCVLVALVVIAALSLLGTMVDDVARALAGWMR